MASVVTPCPSKEVSVTKMMNCERVPYLTLILLSTIITPVVCAEDPAWSEWKCKCTAEYDPICGSDLVRYSNYCYWQCRQKYLKDNCLPLLQEVNCNTLPPTFNG